ncbi:MAG: hypothetical protein GY696_03090 [Gammaproteobacteria bacterium]|nr:hypothetical protein [Gammaproteobacteria bacterium]
MIQSSHRFGLLFRRQICLNPVCLGGLRSQASLALSRRPSGLATLVLAASPPAKLDSDKFDNSAAD